MNLHLPVTARNAVLDKFRTMIDAGSAPGKIRIYDHPQPPSANAPVGAQKLLGELTFSYPCAPPPVDGVLKFDAITRVEEAVATGNASWARIVDAFGATVFDCDVGAQGATINLNTTKIFANGPIEISDFTLTMPSGE